MAVDLGVSLLLVLENWRRGINDENFSHATLWGKKKMGKNWRRGGLVNRQVFPRPILLQEFVVRISFLSHSTTNTFICVYVYFFQTLLAAAILFPHCPNDCRKKRRSTLALTERYFICARDKNTIFWRLLHGSNKGCVAKSVSNTYWWNMPKLRTCESQFSQNFSIQLQSLTNQVLKKILYTIVKNADIIPMVYNKKVSSK